MLENINSWERYENLKYAKNFSCQLSILPLEKRNNMPATMCLFRRNFYPMVKLKAKWTVIETNVHILRHMPVTLRRFGTYQPKIFLPPDHTSLASSQKKT